MTGKLRYGDHRGGYDAVWMLSVVNLVPPCTGTLTFVVDTMPYVVNQAMTDMCPQDYMAEGDQERRQLGDGRQEENTETELTRLAEKQDLEKFPREDRPGNIGKGVEEVIGLKLWLVPEARILWRIALGETPGLKRNCVLGT